MSALFLSNYPLKTAGLGVLALIVINWIVDPQNALVWSVALIFTGVGVLVGATLGLGTEKRAKTIRASLFGAALMMAGSLALSLIAQLDLASAGLTERAFGVMAGVMLIVTGNFLPKTARPLTAQRYDPARRQRVERLSGWILVLAGLVYASASAFAPADMANPLSIGAGLSALLIIMALHFWLVRGTRDTQAPS